MTDIRAIIVLAFQNRYRQKMHRLPIKQARSAFEKRCRTLPLPRMQSIQNDTVHTTPVRIYQPKQVRDGTIIFFHGGGFVYGSIQSHDQVARSLAHATKQTVISVGYSLAPEVKFPQQIDEALSVLKGLATLGQKYSFTIRHLSLIGDSAGGLIALQASMRYAGILNHLVLIYPCITPHDHHTKSMTLYKTGFFLTAADVRRFWQAFLGKQALPPYTETSLARVPPTLIITAQYDVLRSEAHALHNRLRNAGKSSTYVQYKGMWHGFMQLPWPLSKRQKALRRIARFLQKY